MTLKKLNQRERYALYSGAAFIALFILLQWGIFPFMNWKDRIHRGVILKEKDLVEILLLREDYDALKNTGELWKEKIRRRPQGFTLFSFMDQLAGKAGIEIASMKPATVKAKNSPYTISKVEVKLSGIGMKKLTPFLHMVESSENMVFIRRMSITRTGDDGSIEVVLQVETFEA